MGVKFFHVEKSFVCLVSQTLLCKNKVQLKKISYHHEIPDLENLQLIEGYSCSYPTYFVQQMYLA